MIRKEEIIKVIKESAELTSKKAALEFEADIDTIIENLLEILPDGEVIKLGKYIRIESNKISKNSRKVFGGEVVTTPEQFRVVIKPTDKCKDVAKRK